MSKKGSHAEESDSEEDSSRRGGKKGPRFVKNGMDKVDPSQIVVNLSKTHYDIIEAVVEELGWRAEHSPKSEKWDILWTDGHIEAQDLFKLNEQQKISHFPAIYVLAKKNFLGRSLMRMARTFPQHYNFFPPTWSVPSGLGELLRYHSQLGQEDAPVYIFKPEASSQGKGILLLSRVDELEGRTGIVQLYVNDPLLVEGLKFDLRIYVLIYGCDPLRIYIYEEGLARFATERYERAKRKNLRDNFIHLTNYAINKNNKKFVFNTSEQHMNVGHKRSLTAVYALLAKKGLDVGAVKEKIDRLVVKTLLVGKPMLEHMYGLSQSDNLTNDQCFHILGFDVLINDQLEPILLEVNHTPSFATDTPLDKTIKKNLIKETLLLLNVNTRTKREKIERRAEFEERRAQRKVVKLTQEERKELKRQIEREKDEYEAATLKKYRRLYPVDSEEYAELEQYACKIFNEQSGFKNKEVASLKTSLQLRPCSLQSMPTAKKLKKAQSTQKGSLTRPLQEELLEKLPDISPKRGTFFKSSTINTPKVVLKNYEFSPDKAFANLTEKYAKKLKRSEKIADNNSIFGQRSSEMRRDGAFIEPRVMRLNELASKTPISFEQLSADYSVNIKEKSSRRTFLDFISLSNREKNGVVKGERRRAKKGLEEQLQEEVFTMKSLTLHKNRMVE